jgi:O-antigen biosynthesis protein
MSAHRADDTERASSSADIDERQSPAPGADVVARVVAFYLPQFHPIPENDRWWGPGFTDWTNVRRARPWFDGHDQPRIPTSLGYYDLRDPDVHQAQAALARGNGVAAFCYYAYWFAGRRLLEQPLDLVGANPDLAMPYAICWANEPWSRRWDGSEHEILMPQRHSPQGDAAFIDDIGMHLADPRYLRIDGRPLLLIYRAGLLDDPLRTTDGLRERAVQLGLGDLYLAMVQSFGHWDPIGYGFDAAVEFPPHGSRAPRSTRLPGAAADDGFRGTFTDYESVMVDAVSRPLPAHPWFRGVMPRWDDTPRRGPHATVYTGSTPALFRQWLEEALRFTYLFHRPAERLVFINAWNEWGEGAYLEPDASNGSAYLQAVEEALRSTRGYALETAQILQTGAQGNGLLEAARRAWRARALSER